MKKKLISALLVTSMLLGMTACGAGSDEGQSSTGGESTETNVGQGGERNLHGHRHIRACSDHLHGNR